MQTKSQLFTARGYAGAGRLHARARTAADDEGAGRCPECGRPLEAATDEELLEANSGGAPRPFMNRGLVLAPAPKQKGGRTGDHALGLRAALARSER